MPYFTRDSVRLYYEDHGYDLPILLTHGFTATSSSSRCRHMPFNRNYGISIFEDTIFKSRIDNFSPSENQGLSPRASLKSKKGNGVEENRS